MEVGRLIWIILFSICGLILSLGIFCSFRAGQECFSCRVVMIWFVFFIFLAAGSVILYFDFNPDYTPYFLDFLHDKKVFE